MLYSVTKFKEDKMNKNVRWLDGVERLEQRLALTSDALFSNQWALSATHAVEAWSPSTLTNKPIVAIVDSGVDLNHPDIKNNLWINTRETPNDNIDNDGNGYVDDINGWNFAAWSNVPQDNFYHGTVVGGIIGAVQDNNIGIAGIAPNVRILPIKFQNDSGLGYAGVAAAGIDYATNLKLRGENIVAINISWTAGMADNFNIKNAIQRASDNNIVVVIAAGNDGLNVDSSPRYPVSYGIANTITVAAINPDLSLAGYSNYGKNTIDIGAPGTAIESTLPNNNYGSMSGTSFAAPQVSGAVAFLKSIDIGYSASQIKQAILNGASYISSLADKVRAGFLDLLGAVNVLKQMHPANTIVTPPSTPAVQPPVIIPPKMGVIEYHIDTVTKKLIKGWADDSIISGNKLLVTVTINKIYKYNVSANLYRSDTKKSNGFSVTPSKYYFHKGLNLVTISIKDTVNNKVLTAYSQYIRV